MKSIAWMLAAILSFCVLAIGAREASGSLSTLQILFFRSIVSCSIIGAIVLLSRAQIRSARLPLHLSRNLFHFAGQWGWFYGLALLPLAEVFALEFTVPIWTLLIAWLFLGEQLNARKIVAVALGFAGVLVILQPGLSEWNPVSLIVLGAAACYAVAHSSTKALSSSDSALSILVYMNLIQLPLAFGFALTDWQPINDGPWLWILLIGITALSAHYCMAKAMETAEVTTVVTMDFLRLPMIALVGILFYQESLELGLIAGGLLMLLANLIKIEKRRHSS